MVHTIFTTAICSTATLTFLLYTDQIWIMTKLLHFFLNGNVFFFFFSCRKDLRLVNGTSWERLETTGTGTSWESTSLREWTGFYSTGITGEPVLASDKHSACVYTVYSPTSLAYFCTSVVFRAYVIPKAPQVIIAHNTSILCGANNGADYEI